MFKKIVVTVFLLVSIAYGGSLAEDKRFGVEINPFYPLLLNNGDKFFSASFSYFNHASAVEIAIPISYQKENNYKQKTVDVHYRKFVNDTLDGFYFSGFSRFAQLEGRHGNGYIKQTKVGLGVGLGFRFFAQNGFYWGGSLGLGSYITGENDLFSHDLFSVNDDPQLLFDIELLKFGYTF